MMKQVFIKKGAGRQFKAGGSWIYDNEIERIEDGVTDGDIVEVHDFDDYFLSDPVYVLDVFRRYF